MPNNILASGEGGESTQGEEKVRGKGMISEMSLPTTTSLSLSCSVLPLNPLLCLFQVNLE